MANTATIWGIGQGAAASIVDSYSESNQDGTWDISFASDGGAGQSFSVGSAKTLDSAKFFLKVDVGTPTGNMFAKLYACNNAVGGGDDKPSGAALAVSDAVDVSILTGSYALITFTFSGANRYAMSAGDYVITVEYTNGGGGNYVGVGMDQSAPVHAGNSSIISGGVWTAQAIADTCFYVYGI